MDAELVNQLLALNRVFYSKFSADFAATRANGRLNLTPFRAYLANNFNLLDVGCGNGRLGAALSRAGYALDYVGVDSSAELLAVAKQDSEKWRGVRAQFRALDISQKGWSDALADAAPFDRVCALAVLHHLPSFELRARILRDLSALLKPQGILILSNWQFRQSARLRKKIVAWETIGVDEKKPEAGDYLMDWKRGGEGLRYVHLIEEQEMVQLARDSGLTILSQTLADANLNFYSILQRAVP